MRALRALILLACLGLLLGMMVQSSQKDESSTGRFLASVATDKPIYRAGERVFIRTVILEANRHTPLPSGGVAASTWRITGPKGEILAESTASIQDGVVGCAWDVPAEAAGGQYKITASFPYHGFPPAERKFEVRAYRAPRLKGEIVFLRDGYGPGDIVKASLHVDRAEGGVPAGAGVNVSAIVDGESVYHGATRLDAAGNCSVEMKLPDKISVGAGTLSLAVTDGGVVEPIAKTIPILLKTVDVSFYPEGGDLIAWLPNRVYLEARTPARKPADIQGEIVDSAGGAVAEVRTDHEGRGRFTFTPREGTGYSLKILQPAGIEKLLPLPAVKPAGIVLNALQDVAAADSSISFQCASLVRGPYAIVLTKHDVVLASRPLKLEPGNPAVIALSVPAWADGVITATVRDSRGKAIAERLVFRQPAHRLNLKVAADKNSYVPGQPVTITVTTTDERGHAVGAVVGLRVTDSSVLQMPEQRDRAPRVSEMVLLENDVRELADAQVYFDESNPKAPQALDLLLGTQGWRRFASADEAAFLSQWKDVGRRALANREQPQAILAFGSGFGGGGRAGGGEFPQGGVDRLFAANAQAANVPRSLAVLADQPVAGPFPALDQELDLAKRRSAGLRMAWANSGDFRVYAHDLRPDYKAGQRQDFTETLYWAAALTTRAEDGIATVSFKLSDAVTSFTVSADAFDSQGRLGEGSATVRSIQPFFIEPKMPLEVSAGDVIRLPIAAVNNTSGQLPVNLTVDSDPSFKIGRLDPFTIPAGGRDRRLVQIEAGQASTLAHLRVKAQAGEYSDQVTRDLVIKPLGFPTEISHGGILDANGRVVHTFEIPQSVVPGSVTTSIALYPTPLGNLTDALKRLMQEPNGCFEQTSSTTYPLIMADQYFLGHSSVDPQVIAQSNALLEKGYQRLIGFECKTKGYEWFGEDPGHECLSAYALMEFTDMSAVRSVDQPMLAATRNWLLSHRDGKGGFSHERRALHTWITDPNSANAYCTWALLESGEKNLEKEVARVKQAASSDQNSYVKALAANVLFPAGDSAGANELMKVLADRQKSNGHVSGATTSIVGSEGQSLEIETTSLATLAWLRDRNFTANAIKAVQFLSASCEGGRYGSTQSTVLALRAIVEFDRARAHPAAAGAVQLLVDGNMVGEPRRFDADTRGAIQLADIANALVPGKHEIELKMIDGSPMPYAVDVRFNSITPASSETCKLAITVDLKDRKVVEGSATAVKVTVKNRTAAAVPTPIAIIGLPGGLEVRHDQLKELVKAHRIAAYEVRGREVILYWRDLEANQWVEIPLSAIAAIPGQFTAPASRAYLYYSDENKQWVDGPRVTIMPLGE